MPPSEMRQFLPQMVLYVLNIYEPCAETDLKRALSVPATAVALGSELSDRVLHGALERLVSSGHVIRTPEKLYAVTDVGLKLLAAQRLAFPRDKHRLYFLKQSLRRRGK